jgi:hypothetical protein
LTGIKRLGWLAALGLAGACSTPSPGGEPIFYAPRKVGSESTYDPLSISLQYVLDSAQVQQFGTEDYGEHLGIVLDHLGGPVHAIEAEGGWVRFVNTEIVPIDPHHLDDSKSILPNVALHAFGGGMVYRKNAEWFEAHGVPEPYLVSGTLAMVTEVLAEAIEKPVTDNTDDIADVYIWRPIGIWFFSDDRRARWVREELDAVDWPNQLLWSIEDRDFTNTGLSYVVRPRWFGDVATRPFAHLGMTNLFGLAHDLDSGDTVSWGLGTTSVTVDPVDLRGSAGVFYDRERSLLGSIVLHGGEAYAVRANLYPGALFDGAFVAPLGLFAGITDDEAVVVGFQYGLPIGLAN